MLKDGNGQTSCEKQLDLVTTTYHPLGRPVVITPPLSPPPTVATGG